MDGLSCQRDGAPLMAVSTNTSQTNEPTNALAAPSFKSEVGFCSSFKSKRYRDKLRAEIKALETLLPVDRAILHRKLDSQTVFRLVISFFRTKVFFKAAGLTQDSDNEGGPSSDDGNSTETTERDEVQRIAANMVGGENLFQVLDGFLLTATADGTILYVSDNVLQYLGFNQVDLMHRCMYGVVHPDDQYGVKVVLEHTIPGTSLHSGTQDACCSSLSYHSEGDDTERLSFLCRMKCFNGTTAGYLKMHCSGRMQLLPGVSKSSKGSNMILFAFCRPFMMTGQDLDYDVKQNVFWTKHDMDLTFKQLDKKAVDVIGYSTDDLEDHSFYSLVHPQDITTCCLCHKALTESNEIQTMYFRIESKDGSWVWLHSRGKVVTKNSKRFSIVFSHYPVRVEDSSYIQQEIVLRQRYGVNELFYLRQNNYHLDSLTHPDSMFQALSQQNPSKKDSGRCSPQGGFHEDLTTSIQSPLSACPSSWHAMSDRHSPVLPSTHVAHKITQREKQIQFQEFKRRQLEESSRQRKHYQNNKCSSAQQFLDYSYGPRDPYTYNNCSSPYVQSPYDDFASQMANNVSMNPQYSVGHTDTSGHFSGNSLEVCLTPQLSPETLDTHPRNLRPACQPSYQAEVMHSIATFGMPPSPPPSPLQAPVPAIPCTILQDQTVRVRNVFTKHSSGGYTWVQDQTFRLRNVDRQSDQSVSGPPCSSPLTNVHGSPNVEVSPFSPSGMPPRKRTKTTMQSFHHPYSNRQSHVHKILEDSSVEALQGGKPLAEVPQTVQSLMTCESSNSLSCAVASGCCEPGEKTPLCFDPAFHMKIVDDPSGTQSKVDVDLPSIGSFLEYLNDI